MEAGIVLRIEDREVVGQASHHFHAVSVRLRGDFQQGMIGPRGTGGLRNAVNGKAGGQVVSDTVLLQFCVMDINRSEALILCDEGVLATGFKEESRQEEVLAGSRADVATDVDECDEI